MKITIKESCKLLNITERALFYWIEEGRVKKYEKNGKPYLIKEEILKQKPTVISLYNLKGGVSKTSLSYVFADYFDSLGDNKILLADFDSQANLTQCFIESENLFDDSGDLKIPSLFDYFVRRTALQKIVYKYNDNIDILPADIKMSTVENIDSKILEGKNAVDFLTLFKKYNIVIIDSPPSLNTFSRLGLILSNYIFCPVQLEPSAYRGLSAALDSISMYKSQDRFIDYRVIINEHTRRTTIKEVYRERYTKELGNKLFQYSLPEFVGIVERAEIFDNIFERNKGNKSLNRIKQMMNALKNFMFEGREINGK